MLAPEWTQGTNWSVKVYPGTGFCDRRTRTIVVGTQDGSSLQVLLVHEIAHALSVDAHDSQWRAEVESMIDRATSLGEASLASDLRLHLNWVFSPEAYDVSCDDILDEIRQAAGDNPEWSYETVIRAVAQGYGQTSVQIDSLCPDLRELVVEMRRQRKRG